MSFVWHFYKLKLKLVDLLRQVEEHMSRLFFIKSYFFPSFVEVFTISSTQWGKLKNCNKLASTIKYQKTNALVNSPWLLEMWTEFVRQSRFRWLKIGREPPRTREHCRSHPELKTKKRFLLIMLIIYVFCVCFKAY